MFWRLRTNWLQVTSRKKKSKSFLIISLDVFPSEQSGLFDTWMFKVESFQSPSRLWSLKSCGSEFVLDPENGKSAWPALTGTQPLSKYQSPNNEFWEFPLFEFRHKLWIFTISIADCFKAWVIFGELHVEVLCYNETCTKANNIQAGSAVQRDIHTELLPYFNPFYLPNIKIPVKYCQCTINILVMHHLVLLWGTVLPSHLFISLTLWSLSFVSLEWSSLRSSGVPSILSLRRF